jgi:hypothetical protein
MPNEIKSFFSKKIIISIQQFYKKVHLRAKGKKSNEKVSKNSETN